MTAKYYVTLTDYGATLVAQAHDVASIVLTQMVIGDANGIPYDPIDQKSRTSLVNQRATVPVQAVTIEGAVTTVTATVAANIGGFNLHEIGLKDSTGQLVYIGNYHGGYKPAIAEGAGGELTIVIDITAESGKEALIEIDPNVVTANKDWVLNHLEELSQAIQLLLNEKYDKTGGVVNGEAIFNYESLFKQGLIAHDLTLKRQDMDTDAYLKILVQNSFAELIMIGADGSPDYNALFHFKTLIKSNSLFLGGSIVNTGDYAPERSIGTAYVNDSPRPRIISVLSNLSTGDTQVDGYFTHSPGIYTKVATARVNSNVTNGGCNITFIVPPWYYYKVEGTGITNWFETW